MRRDERRENTKCVITEDDARLCKSNTSLVCLLILIFSFCFSLSAGYDMFSLLFFAQSFTAITASNLDLIQLHKLKVGFPRVSADSNKQESDFLYLSFYINHDSKVNMRCQKVLVKLNQ